jgi:glycosyltransferase involved in cell wall biosynthesis
VDYGGPGALISDAIGVRVPLGDKASLARDFAGAMEGLVEAREHREALGRAAARYALGEYSWDAKARKLMDVYRWVLGEVTEKPTPYPVPG